MWDWLHDTSLGWDWLDWFWLVILVGTAAYCFIAARGDRKAENRTYGIGFLLLLGVVAVHNVTASWWSLPTPSIPRMVVVLAVNSAIVIVACWFFLKAYRLYKRRLARVRQLQQSEKR